MFQAEAELAVASLSLPHVRLNSFANNLPSAKQTRSILRTATQIDEI